MALTELWLSLRVAATRLVQERDTYSSLKERGRVKPGTTTASETYDAVGTLLLLLQTDGTTTTTLYLPDEQITDTGGADLPRTFRTADL